MAAVDVMDDELQQALALSIQLARRVCEMSAERRNSCLY